MNLRECEAPTGTGVGQIGLRMRDLNSRVTEEHSRARVRDRHQLVDYHRLLGTSGSAGSPQDWDKSSAYWRPASKQESVKNVENKNVATFPLGSERRDFFESPRISQAPFHAPIRGGYRGGARLPKMDWSDTTRSLQASLER